MNKFISSSSSSSGVEQEISSSFGENRYKEDDIIIVNAREGDGQKWSVKDKDGKNISGDSYAFIIIKNIFVLFGYLNDGKSCLIADKITGTFNKKIIQYIPTEIRYYNNYKLDFDKKTVQLGDNNIWDTEVKDEINKKLVKLIKKHKLIR